MSRISLKEAYDDRSVIVKLTRIEDKTDAVQNTCDEAVASAQASAQSALDAQSKASQSAQSALDAKASAEQSAKDAKASADAVADKVNKTGTTVPQVITGTGGIQVQGDLSVGGDLTVSESGHVHLDGSDMEIAGMAIEKSGGQTVLSNDNGVKITAPLDVPDSALGDTSRAVNGKRLKNELDAYASMVRTSGGQDISGSKRFLNYPAVVQARNVSYAYLIKSLIEDRDTSDLSTEVDMLRVEDSKNLLVAGIGCKQDSTERSISMTLRHAKSNVKMGLRSTGGTIVGYAPATPANATGTEIATAGWVIALLKSVGISVNTSTLRTMGYDPVALNAQISDDTPAVSVADVSEPVAESTHSLTDDEILTLLKAIKK